MPFSQRVARIEKKSQRSGAHHIIILQIEENQAILDLHHTVDRLLIDTPPYSGLGVLRRKLDMKWKSKPKLL
ncbi:MAG: hypothetical protein ACMUEM_01560 [Flavobacteriales bacterium AspAUS03]